MPQKPKKTDLRTRIIASHESISVAYLSLRVWRASQEPQNQLKPAGKDFNYKN